MSDSVAPPEDLPVPADVERAAERLAGRIHRTLVARSRTLNERLGAEVFVKCENLQRTGAFKIRGGLNALDRYASGETRSEGSRGVLAYSSGNHAQAVALAGSLLDVPTTILMPSDAPEAKLEATRGYGAEVIIYDRSEATREELAAQLAPERQLCLIPPYDHPDVIAGQGTAALELFDEVGPLDYLLTPLGGGGLVSGSALACALLSPQCRVIGVEPEAGDDAARTFRTGVLQTVRDPETIADGARTPSLGRLTMPLVLEHLHDVVTVPDRALVDAMRFVWQRMKLVVEPTGVLALAALLEKRVDVRGARVGVVFSGGNVDLERAASLFSP